MRRIMQILDIGQMKSLGTFDAVYSWGVLHHTGNMTQALVTAPNVFDPAGF
jgi:hypothetical protein